MIYFGSVDGNFYAVDTGSGKIAWKFQTEGERRFTAPGRSFRARGRKPVFGNALND